jgi:hypothetical protein
MPRKTADQDARPPSGRMEWWQQSAPRASLAGRPENRKYPHHAGIHMGNPRSKDFEATIDSARAFLYAASIMLLVRRIARAS